MPHHEEPCVSTVVKPPASDLAAQGTDLGPLQGIPYGLKDLIAVDGYRTTWGMPAFVDQVLEGSAHVYQRQTFSCTDISASYLRQLAPAAALFATLPPEGICHGRNCPAAASRTLHAPTEASKPWYAELQALRNPQDLRDFTALVQAAAGGRGAGGQAGDGGDGLRRRVVGRQG